MTAPVHARSTATEILVFVNSVKLLGGPPALLLSWVPFLGDAIVAAAGAARMRFVPFSLWPLAGKAARYAVLAIIVDRSIR